MGILTDGWTSGLMDEPMDGLVCGGMVGCLDAGDGYYLSNPTLEQVLI